MSLYSRQDVERILGDVLHGVLPGSYRRPDAPAPDMPTAYVNPSRLNSGIAEKLDVERAFHSSQLNNLDRETVYLCTARGMTAGAVARLQARDRGTVVRALERSLQAITDHCNGKKET